MDPRHKGHVAQLKIELRAAEQNMFCFAPTTEGCRYDLIIDDGTKLHRVQCKYAGGGSSHSTGCVTVNLRKRNGGGNGRGERLYGRHEIDAIVVYVPETEQVLWLPPSIWEGKTGLSLRIKPSRNNQAKRVVLAERFLW